MNLLMEAIGERDHDHALYLEMDSKIDFDEVQNKYSSGTRKKAFANKDKMVEVNNHSSSKEDSRHRIKHVSLLDLPWNEINPHKKSYKKQRLNDSSFFYAN